MQLWHFGGGTKTDVDSHFTSVIGCVFSGSSIVAMAERPSFAIFGCGALAGACAAAAAYAIWTRKKDASVIRVQLSSIMIAFLLGSMVILDISMVMLEFSYKLIMRVS